MRKHVGWVAALFAVLATVGTAQAQTDQMQQTAQCVLNYTRDTRSAIAVATIRTACNDMVVNTGDMFAKQRAYDQCLVQNLSGAQSDAAALQIQSACRTANPLF